jgi:hypothetical protein
MSTKNRVGEQKPTVASRKLDVSCLTSSIVDLPVLQSDNYVAEPQPVPRLAPKGARIQTLFDSLAVKVELMFLDVARLGRYRKLVGSMYRFRRMINEEIQLKSQAKLCCLAVRSVFFLASAAGNCYVSRAPRNSEKRQSVLYALAELSNRQQRFVIHIRPTDAAIDSDMVSVLAGGRKNCPRQNADVLLQRRAI